MRVVCCWWVWMVVRFVCAVRVPLCVRVSRVCPGSPRCLFTGTERKATLNQTQQRLLTERRRARFTVRLRLRLFHTRAFKGRVRFPKRTRRRSCRDSGRPESAEFFFCFFGKVVLCNETPRSRVFRVFEFFEFFRVFSMGVGFGQGSVPLRKVP